MLWTMLLVTIMHSGNVQGGDSVSSVSIPGFSSKRACIEAGRMIEIPKPIDTYSHKIKSTYTCLPMGETK